VVMDEFVNCNHFAPAKTSVPRPHCESADFEGECVIFLGEPKCSHKSPVLGQKELHKRDRIYIWYLIQDKFTMRLKGDSIIVSDVKNNITCLEEFINKDVQKAKEWCYDLVHDLLNLPED
jgi:hypothetical protein